MTMNSIPVLGIPHYNRMDLTERCIASIDHPVDLLVLIQQGPRGAERPSRPFRELAPPCVKHVFLSSHANFGVAGAWNEIIKTWPAPYWMITNNDIQFAPGDLKKMNDWTLINQRGLSGDLGMIYGNHGASWFTITADAVFKVGLFDENIYPAYLEDCDMSRRMDLAGIVRGNVEGCTSVRGDVSMNMTGSCTIYSDPIIRAKNGSTHGRNFEYYRMKWGGDNGKEIFTHPYNNPNLPLDYWFFNPQMRKLQQW